MVRHSAARRRRPASYKQLLQSQAKLPSPSPTPFIQAPPAKRNFAKRILVCVGLIALLWCLVFDDPTRLAAACFRRQPYLRFAQVFQTHLVSASIHLQLPHRGRLIHEHEPIRNPSRLTLASSGEPGKLEQSKTATRQKLFRLYWTSTPRAASNGTTVCK